MNRDMTSSESNWLYSSSLALKTKQCYNDKSSKICRLNCYQVKYKLNKPIPNYTDL